MEPARFTTNRQPVFAWTLSDIFRQHGSNTWILFSNSQAQQLSQRIAPYVGHLHRQVSILIPRFARQTGDLFQNAADSQMVFRDLENMLPHHYPPPNIPPPATPFPADAQPLITVWWEDILSIYAKSTSTDATDRIHAWIDNLDDVQTEVVQSIIRLLASRSSIYERCRRWSTSIPDHELRLQPNPLGTK